jgi:hypothetical protein
VKPSRRDLEPWQIALVTFATFCSNPYGPPGCCAVFTHFRPNRRRLVKPVALSRTQSHSVKPIAAVKPAGNWKFSLQETRLQGAINRGLTA